MPADRRLLRRHPSEPKGESEVQQGNRQRPIQDAAAGHGGTNSPSATLALPLHQQEQVAAATIGCSHDILRFHVLPSGPLLPRSYEEGAGDRHRGVQAIGSKPGDLPLHHARSGLDFQEAAEVRVAGKLKVRTPQRLI